MIHWDLYTDLTRCIDYLRCKILAIVLNDATECVLNCGIIAFHEMMLDETNRKRGFSCATNYLEIGRAHV